MAEEVATIDAVRQACQNMLKERVKITADNVVKRIGGSKTTVLKHLEVLRPELVNAATEPTEPAIAHLHGLADPFIKRLWAAAKEQAEIEGRRQICTLLELQQGLMEDMQALRASEEALREKVAAAEGLLKSQEQFVDVIKVVEDLRSTLESRADPPANRRSSTSPRPAMLLLLETVKAAATPPTKELVDAALAAKGTAAAAIQKARYHALDQGLVGLALTDDGRAKLVELQSGKAVAGKPRVRKVAANE